MEHFKFENSVVNVMNYGLVVNLTTKLGVALSYKVVDFEVDLKVPDCYNHQVDGLCGNFNGNSQDDFSWHKTDVLSGNK